VAICLRDGLGRRRIADDLGVSMNTVATLVKRLYAKLGVRSRAELAKRLGLRGEPA
jgi:DNA-binding NarL/FixJ family response regulator